MAKHKRYSRKRSQRRNRRVSRKMKGGLVETDRNILLGLGFTQQQVDYLFAEHPDIMIEFFQNSVNGVPGNQFFPEAQTPDQIIAALQAIDADIDNADESLNTTREAISEYSNNSLNNSGFSNISSIPGENEELDQYDEPDFVFSDSENEDSGNTSMESTGGKRKRKTSKRRTNKRKSKKTKKTRKNRRKISRGGAETFTMTTQTNISPYDNQNDKDTAVILAQKLR